MTGLPHYRGRGPVTLRIVLYPKPDTVTPLIDEPQRAGTGLVLFQQDAVSFEFIFPSRHALAIGNVLGQLFDPRRPEFLCPCDLLVCPLRDGPVASYPHPFRGGFAAAPRLVGLRCEFASERLDE